MIDPTIHTEILQRIKRAEAEHDVKILYAVESGSRAWGFASANSDYDVRFIYVHPKDWYLAVNLEEKKDVIEYPIVDDIDINGWDLRKALRLFSKSNPAFIEWIYSPQVYTDTCNFASQTRSLLPAIYSVEKGVYHYRSMAKTNYRGYLTADRVPLKKYFYVLRPLLAARWLETYQQPAPIAFENLRSLLADNTPLTTQIDYLIERKRNSQEKELIPPLRAINQFIEHELDRLDKNRPSTTRQAEHPQAAAKMDLLNRLFHDLLA